MGTRVKEHGPQHGPVVTVGMLLGHGSMGQGGRPQHGPGRKATTAQHGSRRKATTRAREEGHNGIAWAREEGHNTGQGRRPQHGPSRRFQMLFPPSLCAVAVGIGSKLQDFTQLLLCWHNGKGFPTIAPVTVQSAYSPDCTARVYTIIRAPGKET